MTSNDNKKRVLELLEGRLKLMNQFVVKNPSESNLPDPEIDAADPLKGFGTPEHRKKVEKAAEQRVIKHYEGEGYTVKRVTDLPVGYDFEFTRGKSVLHVEVKGTASAIPQFFLTRNEHEMGMHSNRAWRLAIVTSALSDAPCVSVYDAMEVARSFELKPYVYLGKIIPKSAS